MLPTASRFAGLLVALFGLCACATESHRTIATESVATRSQPYDGPRHKLAVGKFANKSPYMTGMFFDGVDRLGSQAKTILETHVAQTRRFVVVDRGNLEEIAQEAQIAGAQQQLTGADIVVTGEVTEFGRKQTGDHQLFGIAGRGSKQTAYSKVSLVVVDVRTSEVLYSIQGAGEYALSDREVLGFGSSSGYDSTLNGKVLNLAVMDAVNKLVDGLQRGEWSPARPQ
jgi:curli biogenesis system outer membrane secretion channel CsgG